MSEKMRLDHQTKTVAPPFLQQTALQEAHRPSRRNLMTGELPRGAIHRQTP